VPAFVVAPVGAVPVPVLLARSFLSRERWVIHFEASLLLCGFSNFPFVHGQSEESFGHPKFVLLILHTADVDVS